MQYIEKCNNRFSVYTKNDDKHFADLPVSEQEKVLNWIRTGLLPRKTPLLNRSSNGMRKLLHGQLDIYVTNNQFKEAMLMCGFWPIDPKEWNWRYCISKKSPLFHCKKKDVVIIDPKA